MCENMHRTCMPVVCVRRYTVSYFPWVIKKNPVLADCFLSEES